MVSGSRSHGGNIGTTYGIDHYVLEAVGDTSVDLKEAKFFHDGLQTAGCERQIFQLVRRGCVYTAGSTTPYGVAGKCNIYPAIDIPGYNGGIGLPLTSLQRTRPSVVTTARTTI